MMLDRPWLFGLLAVAATSLAIAVARWEVIDAPPYYDFVFSFWAEADYLAVTNFDYEKLRTGHPFLLADEGGRRAYMTSVLPTVAALGMKLFSPIGAIAFYHLFTFISAGAGMVLLYQTMAPRSGRFTAAALTLFATTIPCYCTQIDMLGMEIPLATFTILTLWFVGQQRYEAAALASLGAFLMKASGLIVTAALAGYLALACLSGVRVRERRPWRALLLSIALLGLQCLILRWGNAFSGQIMSGVPLAMSLVWAPDLVLLTVVGFATLFFTSARFLFLSPSSAGIVERLAKLLQRERLAIVAGIAVFGIILAVRRGPHLPRYYAFAAPLVVLMISELLFAPQRGRRFVAWIPAVGIVLNLINWNGGLFLSHAWGFERIAGIPRHALTRSGSYYERSHEYLSDLRSTQTALDVLVDRLNGESIVAGNPFVFMLAYPSMGYVRTPQVGYSISRTADAVPEFHSTQQLLRDRPIDPVFIKVPNYFYIATNQAEIPRPALGDDIWFDDSRSLDFPMIVYRKRWSTEPPSAEEVARFYERMAWPQERFAARLLTTLRSSGPAEALRILREESEVEDRPAEIRLDLWTVRGAFEWRWGDRTVAKELSRRIRAFHSARGVEDVRTPHELFDAALIRLDHLDWPGTVNVCRKLLVKEFP